MLRKIITEWIRRLNAGLAGYDGFLSVFGSATTTGRRMDALWSNLQVCTQSDKLQPAINRVLSHRRTGRMVLFQIRIYPDHHNYATRPIPLSTKPWIRSCSEATISSRENKKMKNQGGWSG